MIRTIDPDEEIPGLLREQRIDLVLHHTPLADPLLEQAPFASFGAVVVARAGHPRIEAAVADAGQLLQEEFVAVHDHSQKFARDPNLRPIVELLRERVALEVPGTALLPVVVGQSDLVAVMSRQLAERVSAIYGLKHYPLPFDIPPVSTYLIWHPSRRDDPAHRWLRQQCQALAGELWHREFESEPGSRLST